MPSTLSFVMGQNWLFRRRTNCKHQPKPALNLSTLLTNLLLIEHMKNSIKHIKMMTYLKPIKCKIIFKWI